MSENRFWQKIKSLPVADRWLLGLCVLPLVFWLWTVYGFGRAQFYALRHTGLPRFDTSLLYLLPLFLGLLSVGYRVVVPVVAALRQTGRIARPLVWLWWFVWLECMAATLNYMRLIDIPQEGFRWTSEVHMVLRLLPFDVAEGYWIGIVRLALWLAIAVLFVRKCRRLNAQA